MGVYTEILIKSGVRKSITNNELATLKFMFGEGEEPATLPDHTFFEKERWRMIGRGASFYHHPTPINDFFVSGDGNGDYEYLFSRSDVKNYSGEIESFFDWFQSISDEQPGQCIGWVWHEEHEKPELIYKL